MDILNYLQNKLSTKCFKYTIIPKKHGLITNKMFNIFGFLVAEQILLYPVRNAPNPIFIRLGEGSLLAIQI